MSDPGVTKSEFDSIVMEAAGNSRIGAQDRAQATRSISFQRNRRVRRHGAAARWRCRSCSAVSRITQQFERNNALFTVHASDHGLTEGTGEGRMKLRGVA